MIRFKVFEDSASFEKWQATELQAEGNIVSMTPVTISAWTDKLESEYGNKHDEYLPKSGLFVVYHDFNYYGVKPDIPGTVLNSVIQKEG